MYTAYGFYNNNNVKFLCFHLSLKMIKAVRKMSKLWQIVWKI